MAENTSKIGDTTTIDDTPLISFKEELAFKKKGHTIFGFCCDSRRAVIILSSISLVLNIAGLIYFGLGTDGIRETWDDGISDVVHVVFGIIGTTVAILVITGALTFTSWRVAAGSLWWVVQLGFLLVDLHMTTSNEDAFDSTEVELIMGVVVFFMFMTLNLYANSVLINELGNGIMTEESYDREKYCGLGC